MAVRQFAVLQSIAKANIVQPFLKCKQKRENDWWCYYFAGKIEGHVISD